jgi:ABC-type phosphate/phosphonate transport system ATPase subunit
MQLVIRDLSKTYPNGPQALKDVSLDVAGADPAGAGS